MHKHVIFFDAECPFCHRAVRQILDLDKEKRFVFAPLQGRTAHSTLTGPQKALQNTNSLVLVEEYQSTQRRFWVRSRGMFRIFWLLRGKWRLFGLLSFLPGWISDWAYRTFAEHRHQFKLKMPAPGPSERFLP